VQASSTANMVFPVAELISYISRRFTLRPGELMFTGTPPGVCAFQPRFLRDGDEVAVTIEGIATLSNLCRVD
jgi:2-keto-4-pentenoate hydratase/2-oxohepta-3-ene-1,7-dioic acid hydratase in catechol pathway